MTASDTDRRRALLRAALGFVQCRGVREAGARRRCPEHDAAWPRAPGHPALQTLHAWLSAWTGIGHVAAGMARQGYDLSLTRYADLGWRATFYVTGREHSPTGASGSAFAPTPCGAVHRAAWTTLART